MHASGLPEVDWKARAVEQWTADPCGPPVTDIFELMEARRQYAPWMADQLDYANARGLSVLDVGCGQGIDVCEFALASAQVTGIDLTPRHVELARQHAADVGVKAEILQGDAEQLPFADASFDRAASNGVLHHTPDIDAALREIRRVLRPGGTATIILYNRHSWHYWLETILWQGVVHRRLLREDVGDILSTTIERTSIGARPLVRMYSPREVRRMLRGTGFKFVTTWVCPGRHEDSRLLRRAPLPAGVPLGFGEYVVGCASAPLSAEGAA
jgi:ubiquinone/menaquinone biosynthesis C-methylase UbiE